MSMPPARVTEIRRFPSFNASCCVGSFAVFRSCCVELFAASPCDAHFHGARAFTDEVTRRGPDHALRVLTFAMPAVYLGAARTGRSQFSEDLRGGCTRRTPLHRHGSRPRAHARGSPARAHGWRNQRAGRRLRTGLASRHLPAAPRRPLAIPGGRRSLERGPISRSSWRPGYWRALKWRNHGSR